MGMVEVFKTNVREQYQAKLLIAQIHKIFEDYTANFDLDDCDKILRVESSKGFVDAFQLIALLKDLGFEAEVLPDDVPAFEWPFLTGSQTVDSPLLKYN